MATACPEAQDSSFLRLPGEIRNRIYDFATEKVTIHLRRHPCYETSTAPTPSWCGQNRRSVALTQTCRKIRIEYLPIYKANVECCICYDDLERYLETFVLPSGINIDHAIGNLIIVFNPMVTPDMNERFDILPLMKLVDTAGQFNVRFYVDSMNMDLDDYTRFDGFFDTLLHSSRVPEMHKYIQEAVTAVELCSNYWNDLHVDFRLKPNFWESWMGIWTQVHDGSEENPNLSFIEVEPDMDSWSSRLGLNIDRVKYFIDFWF